MATQAEIKEKYAKLLDDLQQNENERERMQLELRQLKASCSHPKTYKGSAMGETIVYCKDCGPI